MAARRSGIEALLDAQAARITNADRQALFAFLRGAVSADRAERERWFQALADADGRRHETWVAEGLGYLHHPLRAAASAALVLPALEMLPEVNRTGDIFFDSAWLNATLRGHSSPDVAARVRRFLESFQLPIRPPRALLQQGIRLLFRAARVQQP